MLVGARTVQKPEACLTEVQRRPVELEPRLHRAKGRRSLPSPPVLELFCECQHFFLRTTQKFKYRSQHRQYAQVKACEGRAPHQDRQEGQRALAEALRQRPRGRRKLRAHFRLLR